jgi:hypothetical protein
MNGDMAVRSISASISLCTARSAPRTICSVTGSQAASWGAARGLVAASSMAVPGFLRRVLRTSRAVWHALVLGATLRPEAWSNAEGGQVSDPPDVQCPSNEPNTDHAICERRRTFSFSASHWLQRRCRSKRE